MARAKPEKTDSRKSRSPRPAEAAPRRAPAGRKQRPPAAAGQLAALDEQVVRLLHERAELALELRAAEGLDEPPASPVVLDEEEIDRLVAQVAGPMPAQTLRAILREAQSGCRALVRCRRIAFLGPAFSYSHLAAIHRFGQEVEYVPVGTIAAVFEEVDRGQCDYGIVPVENSTDGRIADTLDMFARLPVRVCGEVEMRIHHTLLGTCPRTEVTEVYSRPQAISQCRNWLAKHLPSARVVEVASTSIAAQFARERRGAAAVASREVGVHLGLNVLAENIEDNAANTTRFAVIGHESARRTGNDRTAILFQTEHRFGALADVLAVFKRTRLNLTWIESFPLPESNRTYLFFVEIEGHETDRRLRKAIALLGSKTLRLEILGSYPLTETVE